MATSANVLPGTPKAASTGQSFWQLIRKELTLTQAEPGGWSRHDCVDHRHASGHDLPTSGRLSWRDLYSLSDTRKSDGDLPSRI